MSRFAEPQDEVFRRLNSSIGYDIRLAPHDLALSRAHARMLARQGIISDAEASELAHGLDLVEAELAEGRFVVETGDEDVHMAIERRLIELVGRVGGKLHTARSRNDQVATDVALSVRAHAGVADELISALMQTLLELADRHLGWVMPAYTHLQRAQPVLLSHHLLAHFWRFDRDRARFAFCRSQTDLMPLGAGALAGVNFDTDRAGLAAELGFAGVSPNSMDAVSNRDFVLDYVGAAATCATHLSQLGGELVLWSSEEFGFCEVADAFASGSSIMPQKKNPDAAELLRAKAPRVVGHLVALHGTLHGLPLTYNKDLQEDKEHLFDAIDTLELSLAAARGMLAGTSFRRDRLAAAAGDELLAATDVADLLVMRGVPFREAHGVVAGLVRHALADGRALSELSADEVRRLAPQLSEGDLGRVVGEGAGSGVELKRSEGGTSRARVEEQLGRARAALGRVGH